MYIYIYIFIYRCIHIYICVAVSTNVLLQRVCKKQHGMPSHSLLWRDAGPEPGHCNVLAFCGGTQAEIENAMHLPVSSFYSYSHVEAHSKRKMCQKQHGVPIFFWYCASERRTNNVKTQTGMLAFFMIFLFILMSFSVPGIHLGPVGLP